MKKQCAMGAADSEKIMKKIKLISTIAISSINILMAAYIAINIMPWISINYISPYLPNSVRNITSKMVEIGFWVQTSVYEIPWNQLNAIPWSVGTWALGLLALLIGVLPILVCLWMLRAIFKNYHDGNIFGGNNASYFKKIGLLLFFDALVTTPLGDTLLNLAMTLNNPPGERLLTISFGSTNIYLLFFGLVIFIISLVMSEASKIHAEQQLTV